MNPAAPAFVLQGVRVWYGDGNRTGPPENVRVENGRIAAVTASEELLTGATVWRAPEGAVAMPGLIDAHVHLTLDPEVKSVAEQLAIPPDAVRAGAEARALAMVRAGITTARDLGGGAWHEVALRDRIDAGELPGPRLLCAGQPLTSVGGHCHFWGGEVAGEKYGAVIGRQIQREVDWIKVMATGGINTKGTSIRDAQFDATQLRRIRDLAERRGRPVAAHCHGTVGIRNAAEAGLASVEHCSFAGEHGYGDDFDPSLPAALRAAGTWVSPTVNAGWQRFLAEEEKAQRFHQAMRRSFLALREAGVPLIASTDAGIPNVHHADLAKALPVFARFAEFSPVEVLCSATSDAARALGLYGETGKLGFGLAADILVVPGDPLESLEHLQHPLLVLARGRRVR